MSQLTKAIWGPACWTMLHSLAAAVDTPAAAAAFCSFMRDLSNLLPCMDCRKHLQRFLGEHPPEGLVHDDVTASRYCFDLHNFVNENLDKPKEAPMLIHSQYGVHLRPLTAQRKGMRYTLTARQLAKQSIPYRMVYGSSESSIGLRLR